VSSTSLQEIFGERLCTAAEQLLDGTGAKDVRVLQGGAVVTGIVGTARVYIRRSNGKVEGECSCNERGPCVHVVAISIAAERSVPAVTQAPVARRVSVEAIGTPSASTARQQRLCYLLTRSAEGTLQVSVWVGWPMGPPGQDGAQPFSFRPPAGGSDYPRYVLPDDRAILKMLSAVRTDSPHPEVDADGSRPLAGEHAMALLLQIVATGRAFWQLLRSQVLRSGPARKVSFAWTVLPNGDQELRAEASASVAVFLDIDPPVYVDSASAEIGRLESSLPWGLVRQYSSRPAIVPEQVGAVNAEITATNSQIAQDGASAAFPTLQALPLDRRPRTSLTARLVLAQGPTAVLYFVYNGLPVDSGRLQHEHASVRQVMDGVLYEIPRDHERERAFRARLAHALPATGVADREAWLEFMLNARPALEADHWEVSIAADFPYRVAQPDDWYGDLDTDRRQGWFNLRLGVVVDGQHVNLLPALARYLQGTLANGSSLGLIGGQTPLATDPTSAGPGSNAVEPSGGEIFSNITTDSAAPPGNAGCRVGEQWLVLLDDGRYLPIAIERIQRIAHTLVELFDRDGLTREQTLSLPRSHTGRIVQLARELNGPALRAGTPELRALLEDLEASGGIQPISAPADFRAELRPYQQEGLGWLQFLRRHQLGGILADDMGLGKTVQTLAHLALEKQHGRLQRPSLIVAPVSTLGNWQQELHRFAPGLSCLVLHGSRRRESFPLIGQVDVVITGYPLLQLDSEVLLARDYYLVILDEAQTIKNPKAKVSTLARSLRAAHRLALTGTPVENHLGELWSLFAFAQPGLLGDERHFQRHYRTPIEKESNRSRARALAQRVAPFLLRRTKDAVAGDLPAKTEIVETLALDERQRDFYDGIRLASHRHIQEVVRQQGLARSQITILDALLKLRQACCDPRLLAAAAGQQDVPSAKLEWLASALPELIAEGRRVLLFSQFTSMLRLIEATVTALGIPYCLLTGETQNRTEVIARFQSGGAPLFLISLKAGGTGLNLTAADTVIHYDPWWNPAVEAQATDRAHRIGQDKPVFVYKLIAQGTVEEKILQLQADKHALASRLYTEGPGSPASLTPAAIEALFAP
jgi:superfamily II DNA or RNA helicase